MCQTELPVSPIGPPREARFLFHPVVFPLNSRQALVEKRTRPTTAGNPTYGKKLSDLSRLGRSVHSRSSGGGNSGAGSLLGSRLVGAVGRADEDRRHLAAVGACLPDRRHWLDGFPIAKPLAVGRRGADADHPVEWLDGCSARGAAGGGGRCLPGRQSTRSSPFDARFVDAGALALESLLEPGPLDVCPLAGIRTQRRMDG
jgi:hypothetical protein